MKRFPTDDQLRVLYRKRRIDEAGISQPKVEDEPFDMHGEERLGDAVKQADVPGLSEQWYKTQALNFMQDYGRNIEGQWEEISVRRYVSSVKATSLVEVDEAKLLKAIVEAIKEKEDMHLERDALKETLSYLKGKQEQELLVESSLPDFVEESDPVRELVESALTPQGYIDEANKLFGIKESTLPAAIKKYRPNVAQRMATVPVIGKLPHDRGFRAIDERALDLYTKHWNDRQAVKGEPLKIDWNCHPDAVGKIGFQTILK